MAKQLPRTDRELMDRLVNERWYMLTLDTEVDAGGVGYSKASDYWNDLSGQLEYAAARLAGDGFEGEPDTQAVVQELMGVIAERLIAFGVHHRLAESAEAAA